MHLEALLWNMRTRLGMGMWNLGVCVGFQWVTGESDSYRYSLCSPVKVPLNSPDIFSTYDIYQSWWDSLSQPKLYISLEKEGKYMWWDNMNDSVHCRKALKNFQQIGVEPAVYWGPGHTFCTFQLLVPCKHIVKDNLWTILHMAGHAIKDKV